VTFFAVFPLAPHKRRNRMKLWIDLFIGLRKEGEPLPRLKLRVGEDTYEVFDGKPIKDWRPGSMTGHSTSIEVASPGEAEGEDAKRLDWLEQLTIPSEEINDLIRNWCVNGKRYPEGIRAAVDAAMRVWT
jgi:hypothetical protein